MPYSADMWAEEFDSKNTWVGPPNGTLFKGNGGPGYSGRGWMVQILPQMEEQAKYDAIMTSLKTGDGLINWVDPPFATKGYGMGNYAIRQIVQTQTPWLTCPSDFSAVPSDQQFHWKPIVVATSSYKGVIGDDIVWPQATDLDAGLVTRLSQQRRWLQRLVLAYVVLQTTQTQRHYRRTEQDLPGWRMRRRSRFSLGSVFCRRRLGEQQYASQLFPARWRGSGHHP